MINASVTNRYFKTVNKNWFGQFGTINIPVALLKIVFYNTFSMHENGAKQ